MHVAIYFLYKQIESSLENAVILIIINGLSWKTIKKMQRRFIYRIYKIFSVHNQIEVFEKIKNKILFSLNLFTKFPQIQENYYLRAYMLKKIQNHHFTTSMVLDLKN